jgi:hypothetical protein
VRSQRSSPILTPTRLVIVMTRVIVGGGSRAPADDVWICAAQPCHYAQSTKRHSVGGGATASRPSVPVPGSVAQSEGVLD